MSVRRCGVQRRPRARSPSRTPGQSPGPERANDPSTDIWRSIGRGSLHGAVATCCDMAKAGLRWSPTPEGNEESVFESLIATAAAAVTPAADLGILLTGLLLGIRHGVDWDHIAAITDITSTTAAAGVAEAAHAGQHVGMGGHQH